ncbi:hypothetical protein HYV49_03095, partial [Candidatus Pacearchaeota archaeon]|nr:hypothetical protein [Candidatus Pacearchaeota archaeon]
ADYIKIKNLAPEESENFILITKKRQNFNATVNLKQVYFEYIDRNETFEATNSTIANGIYNVIFFCNDTSGDPITNSMNFIVSQHFNINVDASISAVFKGDNRFNQDTQTQDSQGSQSSGSNSGFSVRLLHPPNKGVIITSNVVLFQF